MTLIEMANEIKSYLDLDGFLDEETAEIFEDNERLNAITDNFAQKIDAYGYVLAEIDADIDRKKAFIAELRESIARDEKKIETLKKRIGLAFNLTQTEKLKGSVISMSKYEKSDLIFDKKSIPGDYIYTKVTETKEVDKSELIKDLELGKVIEGAKLDKYTSVKVYGLSKLKGGN